MAEAPPYRKSESLELPEGEAGARLPSCPSARESGARRRKGQLCRFIAPSRKRCWNYHCCLMIVGKALLCRASSSVFKAMSLLIRNLQRAIPIRRVPLRRNIEQLRRILGVQQFDLGIICVNNRHIQQLNRNYRWKNSPTDVLSFPFHENLTAGELPQPCARGEYNLGDIFLGVEHIYQECEENKEDFYSILTVTIAHGMCHLLGYKHSTETEWQQMYEKEAQILLELNRLSDTNLQPLTKHHF